jgi:hypothetical protein
MTIRVGPTLDRACMAEIRREMALRHFKWDAQVGDVSTLAPFQRPWFGVRAWRFLVREISMVPARADGAYGRLIATSSSS